MPYLLCVSQNGLERTGTFFFGVRKGQGHGHIALAVFIFYFLRNMAVFIHALQSEEICNCFNFNDKKTL